MKIFVYKECIISNETLKNWFPDVDIEVIKNKKNNKTNINRSDLLISSEESFLDFLDKNNFPYTLYISPKAPDKEIHWIYSETPPETIKKIIENLVRLNTITEDFGNLQKTLPELLQLAVIGKLTDNILHELNNSFQVMFGFAQELVEKISKTKDYWKDIVFIEEEIKKSIKVLNNIRALSKTQNIEEFEDINMISESTDIVLESLLNKKNMKIQYNIDPSSDFICSEGCKLQTMLTAILLNVIDQSVEGSYCYISAKNKDEYLVIEIRFTIDESVNPYPIFFLMQKHIREKNFSVEYSQDDCVGVYTLKFKRIK